MTIPMMRWSRRPVAPSFCRIRAHADNQSRTFGDLSLLRGASHNGIHSPSGHGFKRIIARSFSAAVLGGRHVGEDLRCSAGVEETRLYRRRQIQGDVRALAQGSEWLLGRDGQAPALVQGANQDQEQLL